jgi:hypothetical protein
MNNKKPILFTTKNYFFSKFCKCLLLMDVFSSENKYTRTVRSSDKYCCVSGSKFLDVSEENWFFVEDGTTSKKELREVLTRHYYETIRFPWKSFGLHRPGRRRHCFPSKRRQTLPSVTESNSSRPQFSAMPLLIKTRNSVFQMLVLIFQLYLDSSYWNVYSSHKK